MDEPLKRRLIGASVLASLVVIFVPMMFEEPGEAVDEIDPTSIPPMPPRVEQFSSSQVSPLTEGVPAPLPPPAEPPLQPTPISELRTLPAYGPEPAPTAVDVEEPPPFEFIEEEFTPLPVVEEAPSSTAPVASRPPRVAPTPAEARAATPSPKEVVVAPQGPRPEYGLTSWVVQVGAFSSKETAAGLVDKLKSQRFPAFIEDVLVGERRLYRVRVGPEVDKRNAEKVMAQIDQKLSLKGDVVRYP